MNYLFISESCNLTDCQNNATVDPETCTCVCKNNWSGEKCGKFVLELTIDVSSRTTCRNALFIYFTFFFFSFFETENCTGVCKNNWSGEKCGEFVSELTIDITSRTTYEYSIC